MKRYVTKAGDMWDLISYQQMGSCRHVETLINANREHLQTLVFKAGVELNIPEVETVKQTTLPPWRR